MAKINRKYIDKHWGVFVARGILAGIFGFLLLFSGMVGVENIIAEITVDEKNTNEIVIELQKLLSAVFSSHAFEDFICDNFSHAPDL